MKRGDEKMRTMTLCPSCKNYLAKTDLYNFCCYCGWRYDQNKLLVVNIGGEEKEPEIMGRIRNVEGDKREGR